MFSTLKNWMPKTLFQRFLLIIIVPMILVQLIATYMFYERHWSSVSRHMAEALVGDIAMIVASIDGKPQEEREKILLTAANTMYLNAQFLPDLRVASVTINNAVRDEELGAMFSRLHPLEVKAFQTQRNNVAVLIGLNGGVLKVVVPIKRINNPSTYIFILWMVGSAVVLVFVSILFMRNQIRSIDKLAIAAKQFGKGQDMSDFKPTGALEVRQAAEAFIEMKGRIQRQVSQRMEMLAGISHDLKTPLTRMKLHLAMMKQTQDIKALQEDIGQMQHMVQEYLDFARGTETTEISAVNISDLLRSISAGYRKQHKNIEVKTQAGVKLSLNQPAIRRAFANIIDNALRYGNMVSIESAQLGDAVRIVFDDDGPGIAPAKREAVFKPFYRLDSARNVDMGGVGLGLAITKDAINQHGGTITLDESPQGGLRVIVTLPL